MIKLFDVAEAKFGEKKDDIEVLPLSKKLIYKYDYGDDWEVEIELLDKYYGETAWTKPICLELDGLPVLDDVGGIYGYCEMLGAIYGIPSEHFDYSDPEETKEWAAMQGWTGKMVKAENLI